MSLFDGPRQWLRVLWLRFDGEGFPVSMPAAKSERHLRWQQIRGLQIGPWFLGAIRGEPSEPYQPPAPALRAGPVPKVPPIVAPVDASPAEASDEDRQRRQRLFRIYEDLRKAARESEDFEDHNLVGEAYGVFMRAYLSASDRSYVELENAVAEMSAELTQWRRGIKRNDT